MAKGIIKKLIVIVFAVILMLSVGAVVYAAMSGFTMTYLPGTRDTVTDIPADGSGVDGQAYTVSSTVPRREGYELLGWTLDYGVANTYTLTYKVTGDPTYGIPGDTATPDPVTSIREGSNVTLANALTTAWTSLNGTDPAAVKETYEVNYLEQGTDKVLAPQKVVTDQTIGSTVTEQFLDIDGYTVVGVDTQDLTIKQSKTGKWTFTGWCSDEACTTPITEITNISADTTVYGKWKYEVIDLAKNEITFYYAVPTVPTVQYTDYTVSYIDIEIGVQIIQDEVREHCEIGSTQKELIPNIEGYMFLFPSGGEVASDGGTVTFKIEDDLIYDPITGNKIELYYQYIGI